ncbi:hypothetical protein OJAV_G00154570 [Oryzias javanicus]|uniref:Secreted protein n=1 Tax=Oryzias javanicus TaxID=123683 RepID=A0A437CHR8_ORYJA|nr:hypothetical protein OJAV_G00154570 [Oryzias javanicus]
MWVLLLFSNRLSSCRCSLPSLWSTSWESITSSVIRRPNCMALPVFHSQSIRSACQPHERSHVNASFSIRARETTEQKPKPSLLTDLHFMKVHLRRQISLTSVYQTDGSTATVLPPVVPRTRGTTPVHAEQKQNRNLRVIDRFSIGPAPLPLLGQY